MGRTRSCGREVEVPAALGSVRDLTLKRETASPSGVAVGDFGVALAVEEEVDVDVGRRGWPASSMTRPPMVVPGSSLRRYWPGMGCVVRAGMKDILMGT